MLISLFQQTTISCGSIPKKCFDAMFSSDPPSPPFPATFACSLRARRKSAPPQSILRSTLSCTPTQDVLDSQARFSATLTGRLPKLPVTFATDGGCDAPTMTPFTVLYGPRPRARVKLDLSRSKTTDGRGFVVNRP